MKFVLKIEDRCNLQPQALSLQWAFIEDNNNDVVLVVFLHSMCGQYKAVAVFCVKRKIYLLLGCPGADVESVK